MSESLSVGLNQGPPSDRRLPVDPKKAVGAIWDGQETVDRLIERPRSPVAPSPRVVPQGPGADPLLQGRAQRLIDGLHEQGQALALDLLGELAARYLARSLLPEKREALSQAEQWLAGIEEGTRQIQANIAEAEANLAQEIDTLNAACTDRERRHAASDVQAAQAAVNAARAPLNRQEGVEVSERRAEADALRVEIHVLEEWVKSSIDLAPLQELREGG